MEQDFLSNTELYFSNSIDEKQRLAIIEDKEAKHISKVMRHSIGDELNITNGKGDIFVCKIVDTDKGNLFCKIIETKKYLEEYPDFVFCLPRMKKNDRFEIAIEKCVELGITNFIVYQAERSIAKGEKLERWNKISQAAMKQSLRSFSPEIEFKKSLKEINKLEGDKIIFVQNSEKNILEYLNSQDRKSRAKKYLIFGPEGGLSEEEISLMKNSTKLSLTKNRLRAETAIITAASVIAISK